jgi:hypothetical protein
MKLKEYFLSSMDSERLARPRICTILRYAQFDTGKDCAFASVDPPIPGQDFGRGDDISRVVVTSRMEGQTLSEIESFPCFVFVARAIDDSAFTKGILTKNDLEIIGWGELYGSLNDAQSHLAS